MTEQKKEKRIKGIAGIIAKMMKPLENDDVFLSKFSKLKMKALINATDTRYAALVKFNEGKIDVEAVKNVPEENIAKTTLKWNAKLETDVASLLKIATGETGILGLVKQIMTRKVKIKGLFKMLSFYNVLKIANVKDQSAKEPSKEVKKKARQKSSNLFSRRSKLVAAGIIGVIMPFILTLLFMWALGTLNDLWTLSRGDIGLFYSMVLYNSFNIVSDIILLGKGYWYVFIIWAVTGLFVGLLSRDILKSLIIDGIAIGVNVILYSIFISLYSARFPEMLVDTLISESSYLYPGLIGGSEIFLSILIQITIQSFALPMMVLFTLVGGIVNPKPEYYTVFDARPDKILKKKYKGSSVPSKQVGSIGAIAPVSPPREKRYLEEQA